MPIMKKKIINKYTILPSLLLIIVILVVFYSLKFQKNIISEILTKDIINNTEYINIRTTENNMNLRSTILNDKDEIHQFYYWISELAYKGIDTSKQELEPGTEYNIIAYDNSDSPLIVMAYCKTDKQLQLGNIVFNLEDDIHKQLNSFIFKEYRSYN